MKASDVPRAVAAGISTAAALDLRVDDAVVLHDSNKLTLRLLPCDVLARVAPEAHQVAQFEIELAQRLAESESPVAALEPRVEPRVYERDGFVVTLWTYYEPATPREVSPADYANALVRLHAGVYFGESDRPFRLKVSGRFGRKCPPVSAKVTGEGRSRGLASGTAPGMRIPFARA